MAGVHGKNAQLRISISETRTGPVAMSPHSDAGLAAAGVYEAPDKNWLFAPKGEDNAAIVTYIAGAPLEEKTIDANSRRMHYAGGAVAIPDEDLPTLVPASVSGTYTTTSMETVGSILGNDRSVELNIESDTVDTTTLNEEFRTFVEGIQGFNGTLDGLYLEPSRVKFAFATIASGLIPRLNLRVRPRKDKPDTFFQGSVIFPTFSLTAAFDAAIERSIEFTGIGPLELIEEGLPYFPGLL